MTINVSSLEDQIAEEQATGYRGAKVDPHPNSAYSQETDPMTSPGHERKNYIEIDEYHDSDSRITNVYGRGGLTDEDVAEAGSEILTGSVAAHATAGTGQTTELDPNVPFDGTVTGATITPTGTITGDATNNRTFKLRNKTADHALFTITTTATKTAATAYAMSADGSNQSVSQGDELEVVETVGGTGVAHTGATFKATVVETDTA